MSDITIPGVTSKYDTKKLIEDLMKVERIPRDRAEEQLKALQLQKTAWQDVNRSIVRARETSRALFSFQNPFNERIAKSSDEGVLTAAATREALEDEHTIVVKQTASADRFLSGRLASDYRVPAGDYAFTVGDRAVSLKFSGGTLKEFADALTRKGGDILRARVIPVSKSEQSIVIESLKTGSKNRLGFEGAARDWALASGLVEEARSSRRDLATGSAQPFEKPLDRSLVRAEPGSLAVGPGGEAKLPVSPSLSTKGLVLEMEVRVTRRTEPPAPAGPPPGPSISAPGSITYEGITITADPSDPQVPAWTPPPPPTRTDDPVVLFLSDGAGRSVPLPAQPDSEEFRTVSVTLSDYLADFSGLGIRNRNTHRDVEVRNVRVYDPTETGGLRPRDPVDTSRDAIVSLEGIEVVRDTNSISDLIPGVTLNLQEASDKKIRLKVEPDREKSKEAIIEMVGNYNRLMADINILSRNDERLVQEISYYTEEERKTATARLGLLQGDSTLNLLRTSMQRITTNPQPVGETSEVLGRIGISTNAARGGAGGYDASRLRGYLEIDEEALGKALRDDFETVRRLFGYDTDGDLLVDSGVAFGLDALYRPYVETGGILAVKTRTFDTQISSQQTRIETLDRQLVAKEAELRRKYGMMEGALQGMERSSQDISNFMKQNDN
ncbi:MAG TPA: flagellar filament capping protein FliD [Spirochaetia bacterium]|nr:flagellar filament capping protein FliD [Spirochaetales bacterium]HRY81638.1 flagellar filament capping protein FliD [Spirochaetia bacterium]